MFDPSSDPLISVREANRHSRFLCQSTDSSRAHAHFIHTHTHTHNQCRLMTMLMGKCTGFPQGHQGPEGFNWEDQIQLPFSSSSPSPARDNAVCILIHRLVTHSVSQSVSRQLRGGGGGGGEGGGGGCNSQMGFFLPPIKHG